MESTRILSWDVGIKHLAYNLSEYVEDIDTHKINLTIIQWGIINLSLEKCSFCDKDGFYVYEEKYYCMDHCKKLRVKHFCNVEKCYDKAKYNIDVKSNDADNKSENKYMCVISHTKNNERKQQKQQQTNKQNESQAKIKTIRFFTKHYRKT